MTQDTVPLIDMTEMVNENKRLSEELIEQRTINKVLLGMLDQTQKEVAVKNKRIKLLEGQTP